MYVAFDIETGGLDVEVLRERCPAFEPPPPPGVFDPTAVKCGNIGGPTSEKGKAKIEEARKAHDELVKRYRVRSRPGPGHLDAQKSREPVPDRHLLPR